MKVLEHLKDRKKGAVTVREIKCADGFTVSVQASKGHYCTPREDNVEWTEVECGFPSEEPEFIAEFAEDSSRLTDTVYPYTPIDLVDKLIESHGGIA